MADKDLHNRLQRLEGQLKKLHENIEADSNCADVIPQFLAVKGAFAAAFEAYVKYSLDTCADTDQEKMKQLIALLVRA